jgi:hypothetical protein
MVRNCGVRGLNKSYKPDKNKLEYAEIGAGGLVVK